MNYGRDRTVQAMVAGVLWPGFNGLRLPDWLLRELAAGLAGVVFNNQNVDPAAPGRVAALSAQVLAACGSALIGLDEEGGTVTRLEAGSGSTLPGAAQLGMVDCVAATEQIGAEVARRARSVGANLVLAPVADVNTQPDNPVIGVRSFGATPELVSRHAVAMTMGLQGGGVAACAKHFPGHGATSVDSHLALPRLEASRAELAAVHWPPFRAVVRAGIAAVMTAHLVVPAWGPEPATVNPRLLGELRNWGFDGAIVTDALDMAAIQVSQASAAGKVSANTAVGRGSGHSRHQFTDTRTALAEANRHKSGGVEAHCAVRALQAGADLLCLGNPANDSTRRQPGGDQASYLAVRNAILDAIDDGTLPVATLERAAANVARLAKRAQDLADRATPVAGNAVALARQVVRRAIQVHGQLQPRFGQPVTWVDLRPPANLAEFGPADPISAAFAQRGQCLLIRPPVANWTGMDWVEAADLAAAATDQVVVLVVDAARSAPSLWREIEQLAAALPDVVVVDVGVASTRHLSQPTLQTYGMSAITAQLVAQLVCGKNQPGTSWRFRCLCRGVRLDV